MSEENSDLEMIPGITIPLAKIVPTTTSIDGTFPVKRCSSRKRAAPDFFVPTHFRSSRLLHSPAGLRRGPGRPSKQRSDVEVPSMEATQTPASQPLQRGPGRPGKQRSDVTEAPAVSPPPALPLGWTGDGRLQASATTPLESTSDKHTPEAVAPSPLGSISDRRTPEEVAPTPFGSTSDRPMEVLSDEEETKLNVKPSRILMRPPETNYKPQEILDEESKKLVIKVQSLLVRKLLTYGNDVKYMVCQANTTLRYLKGLDVDYGSFYQDVKDHIKHRCDLQDAEREETTLSLSALQKNYEHAIHSAGDVGEDITHTQEELEKAKEKKETLKRKIEDLRKEVAHIEHEEERRKREETKYKEAHEVAKAKIQELGIQLETAQAKLKEIEQRKNTALRGIESSTQHLQSKFLDDLK
ncbi:putative protein isoform X1 [Capsicum annuum]|uniref:uncharacterized protein LOC107857373 isoform X1 n=1 Tax=Capsicum annuum TaxID=4072 RepID=UPI001FB111FB|nr:uncharacterized protein LOC107857373 isoform X1 [Capsicum annuum]